MARTKRKTTTTQAELTTVAKDDVQVAREEVQSILAFFTDAKDRLVRASEIIAARRNNNTETIKHLTAENTELEAEMNSYAVTAKNLGTLLGGSGSVLIDPEEQKAANVAPKSTNSTD